MLLEKRAEISSNDNIKRQPKTRVHLGHVHIHLFCIHVLDPRCEMSLNSHKVREEKTLKMKNWVRLNSFDKSD